ncbi:GNAT family N-acetyltransferase [Sphingomonas sp.]|uniref:GNAT family N-acetyltransferase n=1 Tax=Sphingomonas sp. TaxID=28214 RepID=UPI003B3AA5C6
MDNTKRLEQNDPMTVVLETERLRLRPHRIADHAARCAITADTETMRFVGGQPQSAEENWARLLRYAGHWALFGYGLFAVEEKESGRLAGEIGLMHFRRGLGEDFDPAPEAAWILARWAEGRGYAGEAIRAAMAWHEAQFGAARQVCIIAPENASSLRLAERLGFRVFREGSYHGNTVLLHERTPPQAG